MNTRYLFLAGLFAVLSSSPAHAQMVLANFDGNPSGTTNTISELQWTGSSFTTDTSAAGFTVNSITLRMQAATFDNTFFAGFRVSLYTNGGDNKPGTEITYYSAGDSGTGEPVTAGDYVYTMPYNFLSANTKYWTVVSVQASQPLGIYKANLLISNTTADSGSTWAFNTYSTTTDAGVNWGFAGGGALLMSIDASPVPEPSTYAVLAGLSVLGLAAWRRQRRA